MLTVQEALDLVHHHTKKLPSTQCSLREALGRVLAHDVSSDLDSPPFDKSMRDGFAVRSADLSSGAASLSVVGEVMAGQTSSHTLQQGEALRIMTGAPMPAGADAVVMLEDTEASGDSVSVKLAPKPGAFIMPRGREMKSGEVVLAAGTRLRAFELGLLATVGCTDPTVIRRPTVTVLTSGDEIVPPSQKPGPGQIRNSNSATLIALAEAAGAEVRTVHHAKDDLDSIESAVREGLQSDFLLLAGGVSAGDRDYVPEALQRAGVQEIFHKVRLKPGKPLWFGETEQCLVFGLPGNPVSVVACFYVFVQRAFAASQGCESGWDKARLVSKYEQHGDRAVLHPARVTAQGMELVDWFGSPDLRSICRADAFVMLPAGPGVVEPSDDLPAWLVGR